MIVARPRSIFAPDRVRAFAFLVVACLAAPAAAQDMPRLAVQGLGQFALQHESPRSNGLTARLRLDAALELTPEFSIIGLARLQPVMDPPPGANRVLAREGLLAEELFAQWRAHGATLRVGKFSPNFARAWYLAPGLFGDTFAADAQIVEQIGIEASYAIPTERFGTHAISVANTMADRSPLGQTLITDRGRLRLRDGGPSNTAAPRSWTLAYDGIAVPTPLFPVSLHAAYATLGRGHGDPAHEQLAVLAVNTELPGPDGSTLRPLAEALRRWNPDGQRGATDLLTLALEWEKGDWSADIAASTRTTRATAASLHDRMAQLTLSRRLGDRWTLSAGYMQQRVGGGTVHVVGLELAVRLSRCADCSILSRRHY